MSYKTILVILLTILVLFVIAQVMIRKNTDQTEAHQYTVLKNFGDFEIRSYEPALFSYVVLPNNSYKNNSSQGFRKLAGYIFGGNASSESIAMTTPVTMTMEDSVTMKFKIPNGMQLADMPKPSDSSIQFESQPQKTVAAIQFGGWADDDKIAQMTEQLKQLLDANEIEYHGPFSYLGYNPPYQTTNRRNEVVVEVDWTPSETH